MLTLVFSSLYSSLLSCSKKIYSNIKLCCSSQESNLPPIITEPGSLNTKPPYHSDSTWLYFSLPPHRIVHSSINVMPHVSTPFLEGNRNGFSPVQIFSFDFSCMLSRLKLGSKPRNNEENNKETDEKQSDLRPSFAAHLMIKCVFFLAARF